MKSENYKIYFYGLIAVLAFLIALYFDTPIIKTVTSLRTDFLNAFMIIFTYSIIPTIAFILASILAHFNKKNVFKLWISYLLIISTLIVLKIMIARPRPFQNGISAFVSLIKESYLRWDFSFPSMHSAFMFAALPFVPKKWFWPWLLLSCLVGISRVYFGLHYLSDVIAGAIFGFSLSYFILKEKIK